MKLVEGKIRKACDMYDMIQAGDRVAVGVSGGKDSLALLEGLCRFRRYAPFDFDVAALTLDPCFNNKPADWSEITALCEALGVKHIIKRTNLYEVIFEIRREKNPCSLCARMRRGALHDLCLENGCNKIALGHHMNDAVETFFMNLFREGRIASFSPVSYLSRKELYMIRPMILCTEAEVASAAARAKLPVVTSPCPMDRTSERAQIKKYISDMSAQYPDFLSRTFTALQNAHVSGL